ncbi:hypothetical protein D3C87_906010 [compost metagenome]
MPMIRPAIEPTVSACKAALAGSRPRLAAASSAKPMPIHAYDRCKIHSSGTRTVRCGCQASRLASDTPAAQKASGAVSQAGAPASHAIAAAAMQATAASARFGLATGVLPGAPLRVNMGITRAPITDSISTMMKMAACTGTNSDSGSQPSTAAWNRPLASASRASKPTRNRLRVLPERRSTRYKGQAASGRNSQSTSAGSRPGPHSMATRPASHNATSAISWAPCGVGKPVQLRPAV